jgi:hypothetical protein
VTAAGGSDRKHLTGREIERLLEAAKGSRNEARDRLLVAPNVGRAAFVFFYPSNA